MTIELSDEALSLLRCLAEIQDQLEAGTLAGEVELSDYSNRAYDECESHGLFTKGEHELSFQGALSIRLTAKGRRFLREYQG